MKSSTRAAWTEAITKKAAKKEGRVKNVQKKIIDGITFDSTKEARRYQDLVLMQKAGQIQNLRRQVPFNITINGNLICIWFADFVYFYTGRSYEVFGQTATSAIDLSAISNGTGGFVINGQCANDFSGISVASTGDVNGDGLADLIVGAYRSDPTAVSDAGRSYEVVEDVKGWKTELYSIKKRLVEAVYGIKILET